MRKIKFRGKIKKGYKNAGQWYYFTLEDFVDLGLLGDIPDALTLNHIDFSTLGLYTGRKDKNKQEIYEGDIVELHTPAEGVIGRYVVKWDETTAHFYLEGNWRIDPDEIWEHSQSWLTIIGNIYENPELIGR